MTYLFIGMLLGMIGGLAVGAEPALAICSFCTVNSTAYFHCGINFENLCNNAVLSRKASDPLLLR